MPNAHGQPVIAIDGTSASGKSTLSKRLAVHYDAGRIEYSRFFRLVGHHMQQQGYDPDSEPSPEQVAEATRYAATLNWDRIKQTEHLDLNTIALSNITPKFSGLAGVIQATDATLLDLIEASRDKPVIVEGRTIGRYSYPAADVKLYVDANVAVRAQRRHSELAQKGSTETVEQVEANLRRRDMLDQERAEQPTGFDPAVHTKLDTSHQTIDHTLAEAHRLIAEKVPTLAIPHQQTL